MIYLDTTTVAKTTFETLLLHTKADVLHHLRHITKANTLSGNEFEHLTYQATVRSAQRTSLEGRLYHTKDRDFPDIVAAGYFGIEVKATNKDAWKSIGNSVLESSRIDTVEKIYLFFGKLGGFPDIKYRQYQDCLKDIAVTHYPRYQIDMTLEASDSIFHKMGVSYDTIRRSDNPIAAIRSYYKTQMTDGDSLWWIDDNVDEHPTLSPIIKNFSSMPKDARDLIVAKILAYFPEVFSKSSKKYERIPAFLASQYGVVTPSLRDVFSAGGQRTIRQNGTTFRVPQVIAEMQRLAPYIHMNLIGKAPEYMMAYWQTPIHRLENIEHTWMRELDAQTAHMQLPVKTSDLYRSALVF